MSRISHCIAIAVLAIAAIPSNSASLTAAELVEPSNAPIILLAGIIFLAIGIATTDLLSSKRPDAAGKFTRSPSHLKGWETRRQRESEWRRQHNAEFRKKIGLGPQATRH